MVILTQEMLNLDLETLILQMDTIFSMFRSKPKKILGFHGKSVGASSLSR